MSEKSHQDLILDELARVELHPDKVKYPPKLSYKKNRFEHNVALEDGSQIGFMTPVVVEITHGNTVIGYALGEVLDWQEADASGFFDTRTDFIIRVVDVSNANLAHLVGHLRTAGLSWWARRHKIVNIGRGVWPRYKIQD